MAAEAVQNGWIQPAHRASRMKLAETRVRQWGDRGAPVELLDREAVQRLTGSDAWVGGWLNRTGGRINPLGYTRGLAVAAIAAGAKVFTHAPALAIARDGAAWRIISPAGTLVADRIILATGTYADGLWPGLARSVIPIRSYQMATAPVAPNLRSAVIPEDHAVSDTRNDLYFYRYDDEGRIVTGGAQILSLGWQERIRHRIGARVSRVFPQLGTPEFESIWWGYVGITEDRLPHVHELAPGVLAWIGCNGRGVSLATAIGREMAAVCAGMSLADSALPMTPLRPIAAHGVAARVAPLALAYYRSLDDRD
jgi:glycine/D-amino acid oxidase-like deaminating enzyme